MTEKMSGKENDKRLIIPSDDFEEEASDGLGHLSREEAARDMADLRLRMERRLRRPVAVWVPAAAAVVILLVASALYISLLRDNSWEEEDLAQLYKPMTDTALVADATPVRRTASLPSGPEALYPARNEELHDITVNSSVRASGVPDISAGAVSELVVTDEVQAVAAYEVVEEAAPSAVVSMVTDKKERVAEAPSMKAALPAYRSAAPADGIVEYNRWIEKNIRYPEEITPRVRQEVEIVFTVMPDSTLTRLEAVRSPGEAFTKEALRLVEEGPGWIPALHDGHLAEEKVRLTIVFN